LVVLHQWLFFFGTERDVDDVATVHRGAAM